MFLVLITVQQTVQWRSCVTVNRITENGKRQHAAAFNALRANGEAVSEWLYRHHDVPADDDERRRCYVGRFVITAKKISMLREKRAVRSFLTGTVH